MLENPWPPWNQTNRPHTYEESTMSFRETRHFDINFRETRSISTTFSVPFSTRRPSLPSRPFIPSLSSPLGGLGRLSRGTKLRASLEKCPTTPHRFLFLLFPGLAASFIHAFFPLLPPPRRTYPKLPGIDGPHEYPLLSLFLSLPSISRRSIGEKRTPDARPFVSFFHVSWKS